MNTGPASCAATPLDPGATTHASQDCSDVVDEIADGDAAPKGGTATGATPRTSASAVRLALVSGIAVVAALAGLAGWFGVRTEQSSSAERQRQVFLQIGKQAAIDLTTIDYAHVDDDMKRILSSATGAFHDQFVQNAQQFADAVKQAQSKSTGTVTAAGVESEDPSSAQVLVTVTVKASSLDRGEQPRSWRMRISVTSAGGAAKVSNVQFVP